MEAAALITELRSLANPVNVEGMSRFAITGKEMLGISVNTLRKIAKRAGRDQRLAEELWDSGILEARLLASLVGDPATIAESCMEAWTAEFDSWAVTDACCCNLFDRTPFAWRKTREWSKRKPEFEKRAGFALMAALAAHDKSAPDARFLRLLPIIQRESGDDRNFVRKAVNWALRGIGKRNAALNRAAIATAIAIRDTETRSGRWIAADALRELRSEAVRQRL